MKCERCGREYPSRYYFRTKTICTECFKKMNPEEQRASMQPRGIYAMTTTAFTIDGYEIVKSLGVIRGLTVRSRSIFGTIGAGLQTIIGGNITLFTELCETTRSEAYELLVTHAEEIGANGVIGIRYDATEVTAGVTEVLCYGTAVVVKPLQA